MYENILLVEGNSDVLFYETLLKYELNKSTQDAHGCIINSIGGSDSEILKKALISLITDLKSKPIKKIGIVLDLDNYTVEERFKSTQEAIKTVFGSENIESINAEYLSLKYNLNASRTVEIFCYFINDYSQATNLEELLKSLVTTEPIAANCLSAWLDCCKANDRKIKNSDFQKFWRETYIRYDFCANKKLNKHAVENCTIEKSFHNMLLPDTQKHAWDFESPNLEKLRVFLRQFQPN